MPDINQEKQKPIDRIGGRQKVASIVHDFYNIVFKHPIMSQFFKNVQQQQQESQFTDFMVGRLGGENVYCGREVKPGYSP